MIWYVSGVGWMKKLLENIENNRIRSVFIVCLALILVVWLIWSNLSIEKSHYVIQNDDLPVSFDEFKIAHVSDLHNAEFGENNARLLEMLRDADPDVIAITGDIIDNFHTDTEIALSFLEEAMKIAQCYYVTGNHEAWIGMVEYKAFEAEMLQLGVMVLRNESLNVDRDGEVIVIAGVDDPDFNGSFSENLKKVGSNGHFTVLLSHRPESFEDYVDNGFDVVLAGHAHGGQFRLPLIGGLIAPDQGWFPKYDSGIYPKDGTTMVVSRGIGNSIVPIRINNRPQLIIIELQKAGDNNE